MTFEASFISGFMFFIKLVFILPRVDFGITLSFTLIASASREGLGTMLKRGLFRPNRPMWRHSKNWFSLQTKSFTKWTPLLGIIASFKLSQKSRSNNIPLKDTFDVLEEKSYHIPCREYGQIWDVPAVAQGYFRNIKIQLVNHLSRSLQFVSFVFVLWASLSSWVLVFPK